MELRRQASIWVCSGQEMPGAGRRSTCLVLFLNMPGSHSSRAQDENLINHFTYCALKYSTAILIYSSTGTKKMHPSSCSCLMWMDMSGCLKTIVSTWTSNILHFIEEKTKEAMLFTGRQDGREWSAEYSIKVEKSLIEDVISVCLMGHDGCGEIISISITVNAQWLLMSQIQRFIY